MPHSGETQTATAVEDAGANLLMSLAEKASSMKTQKSEAVKPVTPSPGSRSSTPPREVKIVINGASLPTTSPIQRSGKEAASTPHHPPMHPPPHPYAMWRPHYPPYGVPFSAMHQYRPLGPAEQTERAEQKRVVSESSLEDAQATSKRSRRSPTGHIEEKKEEGDQPIISPSSSNEGCPSPTVEDSSAPRMPYLAPYPHAYYGPPPPYHFQHPPHPFMHPPHPYFNMMPAAHPPRPFSMATRTPPAGPKKQQRQQSASCKTPYTEIQNQKFSEKPHKESKHEDRPLSGVEMLTAAAVGVNRCVQIQNPVPRYWQSDVEAGENAKIPDFSSIVNFPDFISRGRNANRGQQEGKKPCVMCGKMRICSASSMQRNASDDGHIIPRQNKGVCTACDVAVWQLADSKQEIKWCKGCKNFRAWAAFGEKGLATKCVRCRTRQKQKYASTKITSRK